MTTVTIDLNANKDVRDFVMDKEPGDLVALQCSIVSKDQQTLTVRIEDVEEGTEKESDSEDAGENGEEDTTKSSAADAGADITGGRPMRDDSEY